MDRLGSGRLQTSGTQPTSRRAAQPRKTTRTGLPAEFSRGAQREGGRAVTFDKATVKKL